MELNILTPLNYIPSKEKIDIAKNISRTMLFLQRNVIVTIYKTHISFQMISLRDKKDALKALKDNNVDISNITTSSSNYSTLFKYIF